MGKPKLLASIRALHQALSSVKTTAATCLCVHQIQTDSFRFLADDVFKSFNSIYLDAAENNEKEKSNQQRQQEQHFALLGSRDDSISIDSSAEPCSSSAGSSSDSAPSGLSSKRFFFSPCSTNSILEEGKREKEEDDDNGGSSTAGDPGFEFCRDSVTLSMNSDDPYWDFRSSMEEMVEAHGLADKDWSSLQDLLQCYLMLNEKNAHGVIVSAFIDLVTNIIDGRKSERDRFSQ